MHRLERGTSRLLTKACATAWSTEHSWGTGSKVFTRDPTRPKTQPDVENYFPTLRQNFQSGIRAQVRAIPQPTR